MKKILFLFSIILFALSCTHSNTVKQTSKKTYKLYFARLTSVNYPISFWINGRLEKKGTLEWGKGTTMWNFSLLSSFERQKTTMFEVKTMYKDTIFSYKTDSIEELYIWLPDGSKKCFKIENDKEKSVGVE